MCVLYCSPTYCTTHTHIHTHRDLVVMNYGLHGMFGVKQSLKDQIGPAAEVGVCVCVVCVCVHVVWLIYTCCTHACMRQIWRSPEFQKMRYKEYPMMVWRETTPQHFSSPKVRMWTVFVCV
jgi:hypothetical protein